MNTSTKILSSALIAIASLSAASAFAGDNDYPGVQTNSVSTLTRAQVQAELQQAKREGTLFQSDDSYPVLQAQNAGNKTREQVKAELLTAEQQHSYSVRVDNSYPA